MAILKFEGSILFMALMLSDSLYISASDSEQVCHEGKLKRNFKRTFNSMCNWRQMETTMRVTELVKSHCEGLKFAFLGRRPLKSIFEGSKLRKGNQTKPVNRSQPNSVCLQILSVSSTC